MSKAKELLERYGKVTEDKRQVIDTINGSIEMLKGQVDNYKEKQQAITKRKETANDSLKDKLSKEYHELGVKIEKAQEAMAQFRIKRRAELGKLRASK